MRARLLRLIYTSFFVLISPLLALRLFVRGGAVPGYRHRWAERFGRYHPAAPQGPFIWVHAVSVGETTAAVPLIRELMQQRPEAKVLVTTTTPTGGDTVQRMLGDSVVHVYFPYDIPAVLRNFFATYEPSILVLMETELWPNVIADCVHRGIPVLLANARLSRKSLRSYQLVAPLSLELLSSIDFIAAQTRDDADRFIALGARPGVVDVLGCLKFDLPVVPSVHEQAAALRRMLGVNRPILIAGSTRQGEEPIVLDAFAALQRQLADALLVIAPRHPERFGQVAELVRGRGLALVTRTEGRVCGAAESVYLVDTMGELSRFYAAADIAFVGGSLLPLGGQNVLEPAAVGKPVLTGPYTFNFGDICALLAADDALKVVRDAAELAAAALDWFSDSNERDRAGAAGHEFVLRNRGATARTLQAIQKFLPPAADGGNFAV